ncbi:MAG: DUF4870 domain-containing protein [bacterium]
MEEEQENKVRNEAGNSADTSTGMEPNVAGALSYLLGVITGILFYVIEKENEFIRFHAMQSIILFGGLFVAGTLLSVVVTILAVIPIIGWIIAALLSLFSLLLTPFIIALWVYLMYKAFNGERYELPLVGKYAREYM